MNLNASLPRRQPGGGAIATAGISGPGAKGLLTELVFIGQMALPFGIEAHPYGPPFMPDLQPVSAGAWLVSRAGSLWSDARSGFCARNVGHDCQMKKKKLRFSAKRAASAKPQRTGYGSPPVPGILRAHL